MTALPTFLAAPPAEVDRDRFGRPLIRPLAGGKPRAYTRVTTFIRCLSDEKALTDWKMRMVLLGAASDPSLLSEVSWADKGDLNILAERAMETAQANAKREKGTHLHSLSELVDRAQTLPADTSDEDRADMHAYWKATAPLEVVKIETLTVNDELKVAGTPDRITEYDGRLWISDLKTGQTLQYSELEIAMQMAIYSRSDFYDPATGARAPMDGVDRDRAIIFHLPAGSATCTLYWIDLVAGWKAVQVAREVRAQRNVRRLLTPLEVAS